jgi:hypothetical protein
MAVKITDRMLSLLGKGVSMPAIMTLRHLLAEAGVDDVELHPVEIAEIERSRAAAAHRLREAEQIEALGPMPVVDDLEAREKAEE